MMTLTKKTENSIESLMLDNMSVLLIEDNPELSSQLKKALTDFNYHLIKQITFDDDIMNQIELCNPDFLILSVEQPSKKLLHDLTEVNKLLPLPIIIFAENDSVTVIKNAIKAGVSAYVVHEIFPQRINSIISVAKERFKEVQALKNELKQTRTQLESRKLIERAKGYIMEIKTINENEAYTILRKMAMDQGSPIAMVAKNIIDVHELLSSKTV
jgi:response regulator NasT